MLYNAMIFITAQHGSSACDLARDQLSLPPPKRAVRGAGGNRHRIWLGFQAIRAAASVKLSLMCTSLREKLRCGTAGLMVGLEDLRGFFQS